MQNMHNNSIRPGESLIPASISRVGSAIERASTSVESLKDSAKASVVSMVRTTGEATGSKNIVRMANVLQEVWVKNPQPRNSTSIPILQTGQTLQKAANGNDAAPQATASRPKPSPEDAKVDTASTRPVRNGPLYQNQNSMPLTMPQGGFPSLPKVPTEAEIKQAEMKDLQVGNKKLEEKINEYDNKQQEKIQNRTDNEAMIKELEDLTKNLEQYLPEKGGNKVNKPNVGSENTQDIPKDGNADARKAAELKKLDEEIQKQEKVISDAKPQLDKDLAQLQKDKDEGKVKFKEAEGTKNGNVNDANAALDDDFFARLDEAIANINKDEKETEGVHHHPHHHHKGPDDDDATGAQSPSILQNGPPPLPKVPSDAKMRAPQDDATASTTLPEQKLSARANVEKLEATVGNLKTLLPKEEKPEKQPQLLKSTGGSYIPRYLNDTGKDEVPRTNIEPPPKPTNDSPAGPTAKPEAKGNETKPAAFSPQTAQQLREGPKETKTSDPAEKGNPEIPTINIEPPSKDSSPKTETQGAPRKPSVSSPPTPQSSRETSLAPNREEQAGLDDLQAKINLLAKTDRKLTAEGNAKRRSTFAPISSRNAGTSKEAINTVTDLLVKISTLRNSPDTKTQEQGNTFLDTLQQNDWARKTINHNLIIADDNTKPQLKSYLNPKNPDEEKVCDQLIQTRIQLQNGTRNQEGAGVRKNILDTELASNGSLSADFKKKINEEIEKFNTDLEIGKPALAKLEDTPEFRAAAKAKADAAKLAAANENDVMTVVDTRTANLVPVLINSKLQMIDENQASKESVEQGVKYILGNMNKVESKPVQIVLLNRLLTRTNISSHLDAPLKAEIESKIQALEVEERQVQLNQVLGSSTRDETRGKNIKSFIGVIGSNTQFLAHMGDSIKLEHFEAVKQKINEREDAMAKGKDVVKESISHQDVDMDYVTHNLRHVPANYEGKIKPQFEALTKAASDKATPEEKATYKKLINEITPNMDFGDLEDAVTIPEDTFKRFADMTNALLNKP